jgi:hypothetical protein
MMMTRIGETAAEPARAVGWEDPKVGARCLPYLRLEAADRAGQGRARTKDGVVFNLNY